LDLFFLPGGKTTANSLKRRRQAWLRVMPLWFQITWTRPTLKLADFIPCWWH